MGRCVYTGIHEPEHPTADDLGFRGDVHLQHVEFGYVPDRPDAPPWMTIGAFGRWRSWLSR